MAIKHASWFPFIVWGVIIVTVPLMLPLIKDEKAAIKYNIILIGVYTIPASFLPAVTCLLPSRLSAHVIRWPSPYFQSILGEFTMSQILAGIISVVIGAYFCLWGASENHWLPNNVLMIAFCIQQIQVLRISSFKTGCMILIGFFLFELHMERFYIPPPKSFGYFCAMFMFPTADLAMPFYMFEIWSISMPGIFIALLLRFDISKDNKTRYFETSFLAYSIGLVLTVTNGCQLENTEIVYILPILLGTLAVHSTWKGDVEQLWTFCEGRHGKKEKEN